MTASMQLPAFLLLASAVAAGCSPSPPAVAPSSQESADAGPLVQFGPDKPTEPADAPPPADIEGALVTVHPKLKACYDAGAKKDSRLHGFVRVKLHVAASGDVERVDDTGSTIPERSVATCVIDALRAAKLPVYARPYEVAKGFRFVPDDVWPTADGGAPRPAG